MHRCTTGLRPRSFILRSQRSPTDLGSLFINQRACHHRSAPEAGYGASACFLFGLHVVSPPVATQPARVQCASRSFNKVFVGRRLAPLPAPGKYRCPSFACFVIHRLRSQLWHRSTTFAVPRPVAPNTVQAVGRRRCLTLRSSRASTACRAGHQALGPWPILRLLSSAPRRRRQLTSNVRNHTSSRANRRFGSLRPRLKIQAIREPCGSFQRVN